MIEIDEKWISLIKKLEKENFRKYEIIEHNDRYYINAEDLLWCLDDTQDSRENAEEKLKEYIKDTEIKKEENTPGLLISYQKECENLKEENDKLKTKLEAIQSTFSEDDYDKLAMEGIEINE